jgi:hypothetical protein
MFLIRKYCRFLAFPMAMLLMAASMPLGVAQAALVSTDKVVAKSEIEADRMRIVALIMRQDVQHQLQAEGVDPNEALARVATLSDIEIRQIAARIDSMPAGQGVVESLIGALLIVFIVLLVTDIVGVTDVFPFVKGGRRR